MADVAFRAPIASPLCDTWYWEIAYHREPGEMCCFRHTTTLPLGLARVSDPRQEWLWCVPAVLGLREHFQSNVQTAQPSVNCPIGSGLRANHRLYFCKWFQFLCE